MKISDTCKKNITLFCKFAIAVIFICILIAILFPLYKYWDLFHKYDYSNKGQDWANFGSFFGGFYGPILSAITIAILCWTLIVTKKYNNEQIAILLRSQIRSDFCSLFDKLMYKMDNHEYSQGRILKEHDFIYKCETSLMPYLPQGYNAGQILIFSKNVFDEKWFSDMNPYYDVTLIASEILNIIDKSDESSKSFLLAYMESQAKTERLYWLYAYLYYYDEKYKKIITDNTRILRVPNGYV